MSKGKGNKPSRRSFLKGLAGGLVGASIAGLGIGASEAAVAGETAKTGKAKRKPKIVLFGLDSANMSKIIEWANAGKLPTFKKLLNQGSYGEFENIFRGMSVDAWTAYNTGVGPGQNNFFGSHPWQLYDRTAYQTSGNQSFLSAARCKRAVYALRGGRQSRSMWHCHVLSA